MKDILKNCLLGFAALLVVGLSVGLIVQSQDQENNIQIDSQPQTPLKQHYKKIDFTKLTNTGNLYDNNSFLTLVNDGSDYFSAVTNCEYVCDANGYLSVGKNSSEPGDINITLNNKYSFNNIKISAGYDGHSYPTSFNINNSDEIIINSVEAVEKEIKFATDQKALDFTISAGILNIYSIELWKA